MHYVDAKYKTRACIITSCSFFSICSSSDLNELAKVAKRKLQSVSDDVRDFFESLIF